MKTSPHQYPKYLPEMKAAIEKRIAYLNGLADALKEHQSFVEEILSHKADIETIEEILKFQSEQRPSLREINTLSEDLSKIIIEGSNVTEVTFLEPLAPGRGI